MFDLTRALRAATRVGGVAARTATSAVRDVAGGVDEFHRDGLRATVDRLGVRFDRDEQATARERRDENEPRVVLAVVPQPDEALGESPSRWASTSSTSPPQGRPDLATSPPANPARDESAIQRALEQLDRVTGRAE